MSNEATCNILGSEFNTVMHMKDTVTDQWFRITTMDAALGYRDRTKKIRMRTKSNVDCYRAHIGKASVYRITREVAALEEDIKRAS